MASLSASGLPHQLRKLIPRSRACRTSATARPPLPRVARPSRQTGPSAPKWAVRKGERLTALELAPDVIAAAPIAVLLHELVHQGRQPVHEAARRARGPRRQRVD